MYRCPLTPIAVKPVSWIIVMKPITAGNMRIGGVRLAFLQNGPSEWERKEACCVVNVCCWKGTWNYFWGHVSGSFFQNILYKVPNAVPRKKLFLNNNYGVFEWKWDVKGCLRNITLCICRAVAVNWFCRQYLRGLLMKTHWTKRVWKEMKSHFISDMLVDVEVMSLDKRQIWHFVLSCPHNKHSFSFTD